MQILDKNKDFYDFYQNIYIDKTYTFDRRKSVYFHKEEWNEIFYNDERNYVYYVLQVGYSRYLYKITYLCVSKATLYYLHTRHLDNYKVELVKYWKNYDNLVDFEFGIAEELRNYGYKNDYRYDRSRYEKQSIDSLYNTKLLKAYLYDSRLKDRSYPILCESGIASCTDSHQLYMDIEEWLSAQKERELRTESKDITDKQKIVNHGFDTRESFRKIK